MAKVTVTVQADIWEVNRFTFEVEADDEDRFDSDTLKDIAREKLRKYLDYNNPSLNHTDEATGIVCTDRESGMRSGDVEEILH